MKQLTDQQLLALLIRVVNCTVQDFFYFPDIVKAGRQRMEKEEFDFLQAEGYIVRYHTDSFGSFYRHTSKAEMYIHHYLATKHYHYNKKRKKATMKQGLLQFV